MRERELHVEGHGYHVAYRDEAESWEGGGDGGVDEEVAEPVPENQGAGDFEVAVPPCLSVSWTLTLEEENEGLDIKIESA